VSGAPAEGRFLRQQLLPGFDATTLARLQDARVHVVGAGPVAAPALAYLARAGVGTLHLDDGADVDGGDVGAWLHGPDQRGRSRALSALEALRRLNVAPDLRPHATDALPTAALICAGSEAVAAMAAERARRAGLPHVVALGDGDGGEVLTVPLGAPCLGCATRPGARIAPRGAAASALGALAALELLLLLTRLAPGQRTGRRVVLSEGRPRVEATVRRPGCDCRNVY